MLIKKFVVIIILVSICIAKQNILVTVENFEYCKSTGDIKSFGKHTLSNRTYNEIEVKIVLDYLDKSKNKIEMYLGQGSKIHYKKSKNNIYKIQNHSFDINNLKPLEKEHEKYQIILKPIFDANNNLIENVIYVNDYKNDEKRKLFFQSELNNSDRYSLTNAGISLQKLFGNNDIEMIIKETDKNIYLTTLNYINQETISTSKLRDLHSLEILLPKDKQIVDIPYNFDMKYTNSQGAQMMLKQNAQPSFSTPIFSKKTSNMPHKKGESLSNSYKDNQYRISGSIFPLGFNNNEIKAYFIVAIYFDKLKSRRKSSGEDGPKKIVSKEISLSPQDVVEIKLPETWSMKELGISNEDEKIQHSIFLKPVKK